MGNNTSSPNTKSPLEYCDSTCQQNTKLKDLWGQYQTLLKQEKSFPEKVWEAKYNYYSTKNGPQWYTNYQNRDLNNKLQNIRNEKEKDILLLTKTYNDKILLMNTQNNLITKQDKIINGNNKDSVDQLNEIGEMKDLVTTKNREIYFKKIDYMTKNNKIKRLNIILIFLTCLLLSIIILYLYKNNYTNFLNYKKK